MERLVNFVKEVENEKVEVTHTVAGKIKMNQTNRNKLGRAFNDLLLDMLTQSGLNAYRTADGVVLSIQNDSLEDTEFYDNEEIPGCISVCIKASIKDLDYDPVNEAEGYADEQKQKALKAEAVKAKKQKAYERAVRERQEQKQNK